MSKQDYQVWACKIGVKGNPTLPRGADAPMRQAIKNAFFQLTGIEAEFCFSGWNAELTETEIEVIEDKS